MPVGGLPSFIAILDTMSILRLDSKVTELIAL